MLANAIVIAFSQDAVQIAWAFAQMDTQHEALLEHLGTAIVHSPQPLTARDISGRSWAPDHQIGYVCSVIVVMFLGQ